MTFDKITILTAGDFPYGGAAENLVRQLALGIDKNGSDVEIVRYRGSRYNNTKNNTSIKCSNYLFRKPRKGNLMNVLELISIILLLYLLFRFLLLSLKPFYPSRTLPKSCCRESIPTSVVSIYRRIPSSTY